MIAELFLSLADLSFERFRFHHINEIDDTEHGPKREILEVNVGASQGVTIE